MKIAMVFQRVPPHRHSGAKVIPGLHSKGHALDPGSAPSGMAGLRSGLRGGRNGAVAAPLIRSRRSGRESREDRLGRGTFGTRGFGTQPSAPPVPALGTPREGFFPHPDSKRSVCAPVLLRFPHQSRTLLPQNRHFAAGTRSSTSE